MKMRTGGPACASADADWLAFFNLFAFVDQKFRQVKIEGEQSLAVVDDDAIAFKK